MRSWIWTEVSLPSLVHKTKLPAVGLIILNIIVMAPSRGLVLHLGLSLAISHS
jgi:hypothetical protein